jgi:sterol desaturase/sphingolipid hydroxylase (fatty acid hydroxylase superfamily)
MLDFLEDLYLDFFGAAVIVAPEYLLLSIPIAWIIYRFTRRSAGFWRWLTPREVYLHKSHLLDLKLFVIGRLMVFFGLIGRASLTTAAAVWVASVVGQSGLGSDTLSPMGLALVLWLVSDFSSYWVHRLHHRIKLFWPLHAVHHSAEVLTPFTAYRQHPLALLTSLLPNSLVIGVAQGVLIGSLNPNTALLEVAGINAFVVIANAAMANFHHSHIWISFGPVLERVIISPAQHQIHHSTLPRHFDRNYGQTLAIWDWMFGSLYIIRGPEDLTFGVEDAELEPLNAHRLGATFWHPIRQMAKAVLRSKAG